VSEELIALARDMREATTCAQALPAAAKGLETFLDDYEDRSDGGLLRSGGDQVFPLTPGASPQRGAAGGPRVAAAGASR
jgi:hypothetical protein